MAGRLSLSETSTWLLLLLSLVKVLVYSTLRLLLKRGAVGIFVLVAALLFSTGAVLVLFQTPWKWTGLRRVRGPKWGGLLLYSVVLLAQTLLFFNGLPLLSIPTALALSEYGDVWWLGLSASLSATLSGLGTSVERRGAQQAVGAIIALCAIDCLYPAGPDASVLASEGQSNLSVILAFASVCGSAGLAAYSRSLDRKHKLTETFGGNGSLNLRTVSVPIAALMVSPIAFVQYLVSSSSPSGLPLPAGYAAWLSEQPVLATFLVYAVSGCSVAVSNVWYERFLAAQPAEPDSGVRGKDVVVWGWCAAVALAWAVGFLGMGLPAGAGPRFLGGAAVLALGLAINQLLSSNIPLVQRLVAPEKRLHSTGRVSHSRKPSELPTHGMQDVTTSILGRPVSLSTLRGYLQSILANHDSRQIFYFLCLNLTYMFVQMAYGLWANSLGLISDSVHMFFDCLALAVGLFASIMATWGANERYSFGYDRVEILSGFANGLFLILISVTIVIEGVQRLIRPFEMNTDRLMLVSFVGLAVNLVGILAFNHGHGHGHGHSHGHSHGGCGHSHGPNANMQAVFLHILADTLGSIGVIISTFLIHQFGWTGFDPVASLITAGLIFASVVPLVTSSAAILMNRPSVDAERRLREAVEKVESIPGVQACSLAKIWPLDNERFVATLHIRAGTTPGVTISGPTQHHQPHDHIHDLPALTISGPAPHQRNHDHIHDLPALTISGPAPHQPNHDHNHDHEPEERHHPEPNASPLQNAVEDEQVILLKALEIIRASCPELADLCIQVERDGAGGFADFCPCRHARSTLKQI